MHVYVITNTETFMQYVGATTMPLHRRMAAHFARAQRENSQTPLYKAIREYGRGAFVWHEHASAETVEQLHALERETIIALGTMQPGGYNVTPGGIGQPKGYVPSPEARQRIAGKSRRAWADLTPGERERRSRAISEGKKRAFAEKPYPARPEGYVSPLKGSTRSAEFKAKVSAGMKAYKRGARGDVG